MPKAEILQYIGKLKNNPTQIAAYPTKAKAIKFSVPNTVKRKITKESIAKGKSAQVEGFKVNFPKITTPAKKTIPKRKKYWK